MLGEQSRVSDVVIALQTLELQEKEPSNRRPSPLGCGYPEPTSILFLLL